MPMPFICTAIKSRLVLSFSYDGEIQILEPMTLGRHRESGELVLTGYLVGGHYVEKEEFPWLVYSLSKIEKLNFTTLRAWHSKDGYTPLDKSLFEKICTW